MITNERLAELIYLREQMIKISGGDSFDGLDTLDAFRELLSLRALVLASRPALEAGSTALQERGEFHIYRDGKTYTRYECGVLAAQLRTLSAYGVGT